MPPDVDYPRHAPDRVLCRCGLVKQYIRPKAVVKLCPVCDAPGTDTLVSLAG